MANADRIYRLKIGDMSWQKQKNKGSNDSSLAWEI